MPLYENGEKLKELYFDGQKIKEAYFNGEKVYSSAPAGDIIAGAWTIFFKTYGYNKLGGHGKLVSPLNIAGATVNGVNWAVFASDWKLSILVDAARPAAALTTATINGVVFNMSSTTDPGTLWTGTVPHSSVPAGVLDVASGTPVTVTLA